MDIEVPGVRFSDRRIAAADEYRTANLRAIYFPHIARAGEPDARGRRPVVDTPARRGFDVRQRHRRRGLPASGRRSSLSLHRVILHQMGFTAADALPTESDPEDFENDDHRLDVVIAHFIVRHDGVVAYTHDVEHRLNSTAALRDSIEIEFEGHYNQGNGAHPREPRLEPEAIHAGRLLLLSLQRHPSLHIRHIHPHQQFSPRSRPNCPGPDVWVNVGEWAIEKFGWSTTAGRRRRISSYITNRAYQR